MINLKLLLFIFLNILSVFEGKEKENLGVTKLSNNLTDVYTNSTSKVTTPSAPKNKNKKIKIVKNNKRLKGKVKVVKSTTVFVDDENLTTAIEDNLMTTTETFENVTSSGKRRNKNRKYELIFRKKELLPMYLNKTCALYSKENPCIPPFQRFHSRFRVDPIHNINYCTITKNFSSMLRAILCFIKKPHYVKYQKDLSNRSWTYKFCGDNNFSRKISKVADNYTDGDINKLMTNWKHVAFVRDPYERFISAFVDKCVVSMEWKTQREKCYGCKSNVKCLIKRLYKRVLEKTSYPRKKMIVTYDDVHFFPQSWHCEFKRYINSYVILKYGSEPKVLVNFYKQFFEILKEKGVSEKKIKYIRRYTEKRRTKHATCNLWIRKHIEKKIRKNTYLMKMLYRIFYYDFVVFNFTLPSIPK
uniref:Sulfotransferase family-containing protein n=1 Tax=Strongyloides venezuelensis TaxID=75913 RepID=A0A0K0EV18_STRVS